MSEDAEHWYNYFRQLFPKVTVSAIDKFSEKYKGSEEERSDILRAFQDYGGNFERVMETVMLAEKEDEERIISIINDAITSGEISTTKRFETFKKKFKPTTKSHPSKKKSESENALLEKLITKRQKQSTNIFESIMKRYGGDADISDPFEDIPDEEFEKTRDQIENRKNLNHSTTTSKKSKSRNVKKNS